jgi:DNA (cytosine-5)-methyltransferase 1
LAGKRSGLFFDALAFAQSVKAKTILLENVPGLLSSNQGRDFGQLLTELADAGYSNIEWRVLNSQFFGVAQRRRRVFIVASVGTEPFKQILAECEGSAGDSSQSQPQGQDVTGTVADSTGAGGGVSPTLTAYNLDSRSPQSEEQQRIVNAVLEAQTGAGRRGVVGTDLVGALCASDYKFPQQQQVEENKVVIQDSEGNLVARMRGFGDYEMDQTASALQSLQPSVQSHHAQTFVADDAPPSVVRRLTPTECERLQGFPDGWTEDQADSHRYKQMGNAVTVNVISWIGSRL